MSTLLDVLPLLGIVLAAAGLKRLRLKGSAPPTLEELRR
jgi:hypothetical protein